MVQNLALVSMEDLESFVVKSSIKNETWSAEEAAEYLKCSIQQVKKLALTGEVPGKKLGGNWKFNSIALFELTYCGEINK